MTALHDRAQQLRAEAQKWEATQAEIEELKHRAWREARSLEAAADGYLEATHGYTRAFQTPTLDEIEDGGPSFSVTNNIDRHDDFSVTIAWDRLAMDPADVEREYEREQRRAAKARAEAEMAAAKRRLAQIEAGEQDR